MVPPLNVRDLVEVTIWMHEKGTNARLRGLLFKQKRAKDGTLNESIDSNVDIGGYKDLWGYFLSTTSGFHLQILKIWNVSRPCPLPMPAESIDNSSTCCDSFHYLHKGAAVF